MKESLLSRPTEGGSIVMVPSFEVKTTGDTIQIRQKLPTGGKASTIFAKSREVEKQGHFHKGLYEVYVVHTGVIHLCYNDCGIFEAPILKVGMTPVFIVKPGIEHILFKEEGTLFSVITTGRPVPNPDCFNNDWYVATDHFTKKAKDLFSVVWF